LDTAGPGNVSITGSGGSGEDKCLLYKDVKFGRAATNVCSFAGFNFDLHGFNFVARVNTIPEFHYHPDDVNGAIAQCFLSKIIQTGDVLPLSINGDSSSSPPPFEWISLSTCLTGTSDLTLSIPHTQ
jgi:hypothetical protein